MRDELLDLHLLVLVQLLLLNLVLREHLHESCNILNEDVVPSDHDLLLRLSLLTRRLRALARSGRAWNRSSRSLLLLCLGGNLVLQSRSLGWTSLRSPLWRHLFARLLLNRCRS